MVLKLQSVMDVLDTLKNERKLNFSVMYSSSDLLLIKSGLVQLEIRQLDQHHFEFATRVCELQDRCPDDLLEEVIKRLGMGTARQSISPRWPLSFVIILPGSALDPVNVHGLYRAMVRGHLELLRATVHSLQLLTPTPQDLAKWGLEPNGKMWDEPFLDFNMSQMN